MRIICEVAEDAASAASTAVVTPATPPADVLGAPAVFSQTHPTCDAATTTAVICNPISPQIRLHSAGVSGGIWTREAFGVAVTAQPIRTGSPIIAANRMIPPARI